MDDIELVSLDEACAIVGGANSPINKATYYRGVKAGRYPAPVKVSPNVSRVNAPRLRQVLREMVASQSGEAA